jgi:hypothetical protein
MDLIDAIILARNQLRSDAIGLRVSLPVWEALARKGLEKSNVQDGAIPSPTEGTFTVLGLPVAVSDNLPADGLCVVGDHETVMVLNLRIDKE